MNLGKDFVTYLAGRPMEDAELAALRERVSPEDPQYMLPDRVAPTIDGWGSNS